MTRSRLFITALVTGLLLTVAPTLNDAKGTLLSAKYPKIVNGQWTCPDTGCWCGGDPPNRCCADCGDEDDPGGPVLPGGG